MKEAIALYDKVITYVKKALELAAKSSKTLFKVSHIVRSNFVCYMVRYSLDDINGYSIAKYNIFLVFAENSAILQKKLPPFDNINI